MADAICREISLRKNETPEDIETVYLGGGTPGMLDPALLSRILEEAGMNFRIVPDAEITLEANPDDISPASLRAWKEAGINRISLGIQSFEDKELQWMNRSHSASKALESLQEIHDAGFENVSADLIFGSPHSTHEILENNLELLLKFNIPHISCYALTAEPRTRLQKMIQKKTSPEPDGDLQAAQFTRIMNRLRAAGYEHYEISNFALPGYRSIHNSSYWKGIPYLGFGPSAHSFDGRQTRSFNISDNRLYISSLSENKLPAELENLSPAQRLNEYIMISLRTAEGLNLQTVREKFGEKEIEGILRRAEDYIKSESLTISDDFLILTDKGKLLADRVSADLFCDYGESAAGR